MTTATKHRIPDISVSISIANPPLKFYVYDFLYDQKTDCFHHCGKTSMAIPMAELKNMLTYPGLMIIRTPIKKTGSIPTTSPEVLPVAVRTLISPLI